MAKASPLQQLEGLALRALFVLAGMMPRVVASALGGFVGRVIGPRLAITRRARRHLAQAMPELSIEQRDQIVAEMWDNLGRVALEYPHVARIRVYEPGSPVEVAGIEHLDAAVASGKPVILFSGHLANWEIGALTVVQRGIHLLQIYRAANNPAVEDLMVAFRKSIGVEAVPKGTKGGRRSSAVIKDGGVMGLLVDQKMNDGIPVPFFGRDAWTAPALAKLALRYDAIVLPWRVERLPRSTFRVCVHPAMELAPTGDAAGDVLRVMTQVNEILESWIRATPGHWFWLHRRWPS
jgi:Kdo2-lipid IVA lauroyltransferase/acyltransferase